MIIIVRVY